MSAIALVSAVLAAIAPATGDLPQASSLSGDARMASGALEAREAGRLVPARLPGYPAWTCARAPRRQVSCSVRLVRPRHIVGVIYMARDGRSTTTATARWVGREGRARHRRVRRVHHTRMTTTRGAPR